MLLSLPELVEQYNMQIDGVLHVGAHLGEEAETYRDLGIDRVWWVEANPLVFGFLEAHLALYGHTLIRACVSNKNGEHATFNVTNYDGMSSSLLEFGTHPQFSPDTVFEHKLDVITSTIDVLAANHQIEANLLNMDIQGAEGLALLGATKFLVDVDYIMTEVNQAEVYVGCAKVHELDEYLYDFKRVETYWVPGQGWGDSLYVRRTLL